MIQNNHTVYGLLAEFEHSEALVECAHRARTRGFRHTDAFTPYPIEGLAEELGAKETPVAAIALTGGLIGGIGGYIMQYFSAVIDYPINIGGRPLHSWPSFIIVTFELTILFAGLCAAFGMLALNDLPKPHHPLFGVPEFARVNVNRFFFCIEARDPLFDRVDTRAFLEEFQPVGVYDVPNT